MPITTSIVLGGIQTAVGVGQFLKGQSIAKKNKRPDYNIPDEIKQNLSQAQMAALEGLPPEQKQQFIENTQRQQNFGLNALGDRKAGLTGLATLTQQGNDANKNLLSMDAAARQQNQQGLMDARTQMAGYKDKQFELNKLLPFQQTAEAAKGLQGSGLQNIMGGLGSAQNTFENQSLAKAYGRTQPGSTPQLPGASGGTGVGGLNQQAPQRSDVMNQYQIAKMSNPNLSLADFMKTQPNQGGLNMLNK